VTVFDFEATFGDDYLHFHAGILTDHRSNQEAAEIAGLLDLAPGAKVLDAPCGHGRIANRLAAAGIEVVGIDASAPFVDLARGDARARSVEVRYEVGDLRHLPVAGYFDAAVCWFNSFGYFEDDENRAVLAEFRRVLRPGGRLLLETLHHDGFIRHFTAAPDATVVEADGDTMVDVTDFDVDSGRLVTRRTVFRGASVRRSSHFVRLPTVPEWRSWLAGAGFSASSFTDRGGTPLTLDSWRLVVLATA